MFHDVVVWRQTVSPTFRLPMKNIISKSRRKTPWTGVPVVEPLQQLIENTTRRDYEHRHPSIEEVDEASYLNKCNITKCRFCNSERIVKNGHSENGMIRYLCKSCGRRFNILTNTIFDNHKIPITEWVGFLLDILGYGSFILTSKVNRNANNTTKYWIDKTFLLLDGIQKDIVLEGTVWLDETFIKVRNPDIHHKENGQEYRGISRNQICIGIARDAIRAVFYFEGYGKPSGKKVNELFSQHIKPGAKIIHDMERAHEKLILNLSLQSEAYNSRDLKKLPDKDNPLNPVNQLCRLLQMFLHSHSGFIRDDIQGYLNLFSVIINPPENKYEKVEKLLKCALNNPILLRYR